MTISHGETDRFDATERALHWSTAVLMLVLLGTAAALYIDPLSTWVGRRASVRDVHVVAGLALPVPWLLALARRSPGFVDDLARLNRWTVEDRRWLRSWGRDPFARIGKFHPLQKVTAAFVAGSVPVMLGTGVVMRWFSPFPLSWRRGATFVHDWLAVGLFAFVVVHVAKAVGDGQALRGMWRGRVRLDWARRRHPRWADELAEAAEATGGDPRSAPGSGH